MPVSTSPNVSRRLVLGVAALAIAASASMASAGPRGWFSGDKIKGNGSFKKQSRELAHFTGLSLGLHGNVELHIGNTESVSIETDDNLLPLIETVIEDGVLKIRPTKKHMNLETSHMKIVVQAKSIDRIALGGSGSIEADALRGAKLQFDIGGSGSMHIKSVESDSVSVNVGGSGNFSSAGSAAKLSVSIGGSGNVQAGQMAANDVSANIAGSGKATVWAKNKLNLTIAGSGDVDYYGDPAVSKTVAGSGSANHLGSAPK